MSPPAPPLWPNEAGAEAEAPASPETSPLRWRLVANLAGTGWAALLGLALVPIYVNLLGVEAYGLIGLYATIQALAQAFDLGLSSTMSREMARHTSLGGPGVEQRNLARTLEVVYWAIGIVPVLLVISLAPAMAANWVRAAELSPREVETSVVLMGLSVLFQWPISVYVGGLMGLQRQVLLNGAKAVVSTLGAIGSVIVLSRLSATITAFFAWQVIVAALQVGVLGSLFWRSLPRDPRRPAFIPGLLKGVWRFAAGLTVISVAGLILTQIDKVVLSRAVPLQEFGYYSLAGVIAGGITLVLVAPTFNVFFPRFSAQVAARLQRELRGTYHLASQVMAVLVLPVTVVIVAFAPEIVQLWTSSEQTAIEVAPILRVLILGTALNGLMYIPYALQLAHAWTGLAIRLSLLFLLLALPMTVALSLEFGPIGAATVWAAESAIYVLVGVPLTHRKLLKGEAGAWFLRDTLVPGVAAAVVVVLLRYSTLPSMTGPEAAGRLLVALAASVVAAALVASELRPRIQAQAGAAISALRRYRRGAGSC